MCFPEAVAVGKSEVSFRELTRVALLESCPSLLEYTRGRCRPPPRGERLRYVEAVALLPASP